MYISFSAICRKRTPLHSNAAFFTGGVDAPLPDEAASAAAPLEEAAAEAGYPASLACSRAALALLLVGLGSFLVGVIFTVFGAGTLAMGRARQ